ncbi:hypothetical protein D6764_01425 [Candidatus Woesearchaeota archaeon]|nr:MAG: hypothetical protein D6764_01425 [Candidatus Woesearchaeota archaeon]
MMKKMTEYVALASPKGGVGKTALAASIALLLAREGHDVLLADFNFSSPDIALHLSINNPPQTLTDVLKGHIPLNGALYSHKAGLKVLPASQHSHSHELFPLLHKHLPYLAEQADIIIADFPSRADAQVLNLLATFDKSFIVSSNDRTSQRRAAEFEQNLRKLNPGRVFHIINQVRPLPSPERTSDVHGVFHVPFDAEFHEALHKGNLHSLFNKPTPALNYITLILRKVFPERIKPGMKIGTLIS